MNNRGELRILLGITPQGMTVPLGAWSDKSWQDIKMELKSQPKEKWPKANVLVSDGELGLVNHLSDFVNEEQRCH